MLRLIAWVVLGWIPKRSNRPKRVVTHCFSWTGKHAFRMFGGVFSVVLSECGEVSIIHDGMKDFSHPECGWAYEKAVKAQRDVLAAIYEGSPQIVAWREAMQNGGRLLLMS